MLNTEFYDILDAELTQLVEDNGFHPALKHKGIEKNKPFALLLWFLRLYGRTFRYSQYITEGRGDSSCDIIFDVEDAKKRKVYYVVQAKWNNKKNSSKKIDTKEFKATLDDFRLVFLRKKGRTDNENFNEKYQELKQHIAQNGEVKFVYFALCNVNPDVMDNAAAFESTYSTPIQILDINRIKRDYINFQYKQIIFDNPLEGNYLPNSEIVDLPIERLDIDRNFLEINTLYPSHIFLIRPKVIFELFERYKHKLFFKNVRNPLNLSTVNDNMKATLEKEKENFWYYNNGITAITNGIIDNRINYTADSIKLDGFQIINGAQTVHAVYEVYRKAPDAERDRLNRVIVLTLRLITTTSDETVTKITKFTNSHNPLEDRDFRVNDEVQVRLQEASFDTLYWYERRRGEFTNMPKDVTILSNKDGAVCYYYFTLYSAGKIGSFSPDKLEYSFLSFKEDKKGFYEEIFDEAITFKELLAAYLLTKIAYPDFSVNDEDNDYKQADLMILPFTRVILEKYVNALYEGRNLFDFIIESYEKNPTILKKILAYTAKICLEVNEDFGKNITLKEHTSKYHFKLEAIEMTNEIIQEIEQIDLENLSFQSQKI